MWIREAKSRLESLGKQFPAILILGARQVGKTTLARATFPSLNYRDLEEPATRGLFEDDVTFQITSRSQPGLILDEAQTVPDVFPALRGIIDRDRATFGRYVLVGSPAGAEIDFVIDRGSALEAIEIKAGGSGRVRGTNRLERSVDEIGATRATVIDQAEGVERMSPRVSRRGFRESLGWLP
jgi:predicted AAA+ superfamily ATPase